MAKSEGKRRASICSSVASPSSRSMRIFKDSSRPRCGHRDKSGRLWSDPPKPPAVHDLNLVVGANDPDLALVGKVAEVTSRLNGLRDGDPANVRLTARLPHFATHEKNRSAALGSDIDRSKPAAPSSCSSVPMVLPAALICLSRYGGDRAILSNAAGEWDGQRAYPQRIW